MKKISYFFMVLLFASCVTTKIPVSIEQKPAEAAQVPVAVYNSSLFSVALARDTESVRGGRIVLDTLAPGTNTTIQLRESSDSQDAGETVLYVTYYVPLPLAESDAIAAYDKTISIHTVIGKNKKNRIDIPVPHMLQTDTHSSFIQLQNNSEKTVNLRRKNTAGITLESRKSNALQFSSDEMLELYLPDERKAFDIQIKEVVPNTVYYYTYNGKKLYFTHCLPLERVFEKNVRWSKILADSFENLSILNLPDEKAYIISGTKVPAKTTENKTGYFAKIDDNGTIIQQTDYAVKDTVITFTTHSVSTANIYVAGTCTKNQYETAFIAKYTKAGAQQWVFTLPEQSVSVFYSLINDSPDSLIAAGYKEEDGNLYPYMIRITDSGTSAQLDWQVVLSDFNDSYIPVLAYNQFTKTAAGTVQHIENAHTALFTFTVQEKKASPLVIKQNVEEICGIASITFDAEGNIYAGGETIVKQNEKSAYAILKFDSKLNVLNRYVGKDTYSYIASLVFDNRQNVLIASGTKNAQNARGLHGTSFALSLNTALTTVLWEKDYTIRTPVTLQTTIAHNYGYVFLHASLNDYGDFCAPYTLMRTNAVGE